jgi:hypothetical protein
MICEKGTIGLTLSQSNMPFSSEGISPDLIINPQGIPSRMCVGHLLECLFGKVGALMGMEVDGTSFNEMDIEKVKDMLEKMGYERNATEYLYNGMTGQKMKMPIYIGPNYYQRLKHLVMDKMHCLKMDHEVLTENGWKTYSELSLNDKIATLNKNTLKLEYQQPTHLHYYPNYDGKMYRIKTTNIDLDVTSEHRMFVSNSNGNKWEKYDYVLAKDIIGKQVRYIKNAIWDVQEYQFILPSIITNSVEQTEKRFNMNDWLTFLGIWIAEGWADSDVINGHFKVVIASNKQCVKDALYDVVPRLGYNYQDNDNKFVISNKQLWNYMKDYSLGASNKKLPDWISKLNKEQSIKLIESMILGDGSYVKNDLNKYYYYTTSNKLAGQFQQLCLQAGWSSNATIHIKAGNKTMIKEGEIKSNYDVIILSIIKNKNNPSVNNKKSNNTKKFSEEYYDFKGEVFCVSVPNEIFYVKRNGIPCWTGNSRARGPITMLTHQP